jgi:hypothetical protein
MIEEYTMRRFEYKTFSRSFVESLYDRFDFLVGDRDKITLLRKVLTNYTIHVLVRGSLPG